MSYRLPIRPLLVSVVALTGYATGCAHYQPQPVSPAQTAAQLDNRRLDDAGLKQFLAQNLGHHPDPAVTGEWDLKTLTLAAFYYHPDLAVARAEWEVAAGGIRTAGARPNPSITATPGYDSGIPDNFSPWLIPVTLDIPIETAGKRGKRLAEAEKAAESARWNFVSAAWQVRSHVRASLLDLRMAGRRTDLQRQRLDLQKEIVRRLEQRLAAGDIARPELTVAQIALNQARMDLASVEAQREQARSQLAEALGVSREAVEKLRLNLALPQAVPEALTTPEARRKALQGRADILGALADYAAAEADLNLQVAKQYPDLHLGPGYAWNNGNAGDSQWSLGVTLELPILDQNQGPIAEATARRKLAGAKFLALQAQVIAQIDRAKAGLIAARAQVQEGKELLEQSVRQEQAIKAQVEAGAADQSDLLGAALAGNAIRLAQVDGEAQFQSALGALEDALQQPAEWNELALKVSAQELKGNAP